jgi:O-antigen ligase
MTKMKLDAVTVSPKPRHIQIISYIYFCLFGITPLVFLTQTSELFEFNKMIFVYFLTICLLSAWVYETIITKRIPFKRSLLDIPLALFLSSQAVSTLFSIDSRISLLGYYSRWNGGLLSLVSYAILYWGAVTFLDRKIIQKLIIAIFVSTAISSVWGIMEHFGHSLSCLVITGSFDVSCWVQEVALRVFATFGQPNWMAAWLTAVLPLTLTFMIGNGESFTKKITQRWFLVSTVVSFITVAALLFTKSRSGLLALAAEFFIFFALFLASNTKDLKTKIVSVLTVSTVLLVAIAVIGTPWTPNISEVFQKQSQVTQVEAVGPALETGGTESGEIRRIVWQGAVNVWKKYPVIGSGVETFALSYYQGRPMAHNLTSEWNFLYNKAHNEYLNFLATTGGLGLISYLFLIISTLYLFTKLIFNTKGEKNNIDIALVAGFISILITNFFGFSVVTTNLLFFMFPALALINHSVSDKKSEKTSVLESWQWISFGVAIVVILFTLYSLFNYWKADTFYAEATKDKANNDYTQAISHINSAIKLATEPVYFDFRADIYATLTTVADQSKEESLKKTLIDRTLLDLETTKAASPVNVKLLKSRANILSDIVDIDTSKMPLLIDSLNLLTRLAPTDPSVLYQRGLARAKQGEIKQAISDLEMSVSMKPNYKIARRLLSFLYKENGETDKSKEQLNYILKNISPDDTSIQDELKAL